MLENVPMYMVLNVKQCGDKSLFFFSLLEAESHLPGVAVVALLAHWLEVHLRRKNCIFSHYEGRPNCLGVDNVVNIYNICYIYISLSPHRTLS